MWTNVYYVGGRKTDISKGIENNILCDKYQVNNLKINAQTYWQY